jgi:hypothetical protein
MFQRIKNLLDISRYTVEELRTTKETYVSSVDYIDYGSFRPATIINMKEEDPLKDFIDETTEQSFNDTAARN